jgi:hypothetical protein
MHTFNDLSFPLKYSFKMKTLILTIMILSFFEGFAVESRAYPLQGSFPSPKFNSTRIPGTVFLLKEDTLILSDFPSFQNALLLRREIMMATGLHLSTKVNETADREPNSIILFKDKDYPRGENANISSNHEEGYYLSITEDNILISCLDLTGQLYGVMTLLQLIDPKTRTIPTVEIHDWPKMIFRGLRGHLPRNNPEEIENFKRIIRAMAFCKLNQLWIRDLYVRRFPASLKLDSHPEICDGDALPKNVAKELIEYASKYNVKVMGSLAATADIVWSVHPDLIEMAPHESPFTVKIKHEKNRTPKYRFGSRFNFCPSQEGTYKLLFDLVDEIIPLFSSEVFDLGIDEVDQDYNGSRWVACNLCKGKDPAKLFAQYVNRLADYVIAKGKIPLVNSTPFIKEHGGDFNHIYKSVVLIRKDIMINNWSEGHVRRVRSGWYKPPSKFTSTDYFSQFGLKKMIHLVGHGSRWQDRPELLEKKGKLDCYGAFVAHYSYMTDGNFINSQTIDELAFSSNHFWTPNLPEMGSKEEDLQILYGKKVIREILEGKSFIQAATNARSIVSESK